MGKIIIVEDSRSYINYIQSFLNSIGWDSVAAMSRKMAMSLISKASDEDIVLSDMRLGDGEASDLLEWMNKANIHNPLIVMTNYFETTSAVNALKLGAKDFINKLALEMNLPPLLCTLKKELESRYTKSEPIFNRQSRAYQSVMEMVRMVASTDVSVLITGESGTGKEHVAKKIHEMSPRHKMMYDKVDCGTLDENLAISVLFGHLKGSYTGATDPHKGLFEVANGGTLFLDEVGNLTNRVQQMLLAALQDKIIRPMGSETVKPVDVRVVAATNEDLEKAVQEGRFRSDLMFRLNVFPIRMPALRECKEDVVPLAEFFRENSKCNKELKGFTSEAKKKLTQHDWPGNVRELKNVVERAAIFAKGEEITSDDIMFDNITQPLRKSLLLNDPDEEKQKIIEALESTGGNVADAIEKLGIGRTTLYDKADLYGIKLEDFRVKKK